MAKLQAYDAGIDTVEANHALGFKADFRDLAWAAAILHDLRMTRVRLLTNKPRKARALSAAGVDVVERRSARWCPQRTRSPTCRRKNGNGTRVERGNFRSRACSAGHRGATVTRKEQTMGVSRQPIEGLIGRDPL